jgi:hypothetical protein
MAATSTFSNNGWFVDGNSSFIHRQAQTEDSNVNPPNDSQEEEAVPEQLNTTPKWDISSHDWTVITRATTHRPIIQFQEKAKYKRFNNPRVSTEWQQKQISIFISKEEGHRDASFSTQDLENDTVKRGQFREWTRQIYARIDLYKRNGGDDNVLLNWYPDYEEMDRMAGLTNSWVLPPFQYRAPMSLRLDHLPEYSRSPLLLGIDNTPFDSTPSSLITATPVLSTGNVDRDRGIYA